MIKFISSVAPLIETFIAYRKASDNWNDISYGRYLMVFDRFCAQNYPDAEVLSQEMVDVWCRKRDTESNSSCGTRIYSIVSMVRYAQSRGLTTINPPLIPMYTPKNYIPHAFTMPELVKFFGACDNLPSKPRRKVILSRKLIIPVFFRLLYSSGIRTTEARLLRVCDVDLLHGILNIQLSKGYDQHYVALDDSMCSLLRQYDSAISQIYPNRITFFPSPTDNPFIARWVSDTFRKIWGSVNDSYAVPYEFRHNYAIVNIDKWVDKGFEFDDKLLYLSKSMGHKTTENTKYYYSLTPSLAKILEEKTNADFEQIVPEVPNEESK